MFFSILSCMCVHVGGDAASQQQHSTLVINKKTSELLILLYLHDDLCLLAVWIDSSHLQL